MGWDAFQHEVLAALGHPVYDVVVASAAATTPVRESDDREATPLMRALARAAGVPVTALPPLPPMAQLRTPAGKRALWPPLRALRRSRRP